MGTSIRRAVFAAQWSRLKSECRRVGDAASRHREIRTYCSYSRRPLTTVVEILWSLAYTLPPYWPEALFFVAIIVWKWRVSLWLFLAAVTLATFMAVMAVQWTTELTMSTPKVPPCTYSVIYLQCGEAWAFLFGWASILVHLAKLILVTKLLAIFLDALTEHRVSGFADHIAAKLFDAAGMSRDYYLDLLSPGLMVIVCLSALLVDYEERKIMTSLSMAFNFISLICLLSLFLSTPHGADGTAKYNTSYSTRRPIFVQHTDGGFSSVFSKILKLTAILASLLTSPLTPNRPGHYAKFLPRAALLVAFLNMALVHTQIIAAGFTGYMGHFQGNNLTNSEFNFLGHASDVSIPRRVLFFMTCGLACLAVTFSAPLLQTPIIHTAVTMAKDGLLPAQLARDSRVPLVVTEFLLCVLPCFCYDAEDVATVGAVAASVVVCVTVYCCLDIRLSTPGSLVSIADYEQHSRALSAGHKQRKTNAASRYQETIKTLRRGMENLPQTVLAATRSKSNDRQKILAKTESLQSVSATVDSSFQVASENESKALESAVKDYQTKHKTRHHHTNHHHHQHHQRSGSEPGLSYACSVTILAAGTSIFSLLLNLSIKLAASGLVIIDLLFLIFVLLPNICGMSRLKQNSQPFHDSYRFPSQGIGATVTLVTAKTLLIRAGFDYAFAVTVWILVGFCTYIFYGSKNSLAALRKRRLHSGPWEAAMSEGESSDPRPDLWRQCGQNEQNYRTNPEEPITEKEEESTKTGQETSEVAVIGTEVLSTSNAVL